MVTYASGLVKSKVDYIIVQQEVKAKVCNVKVIPNEECVPKHKLLVIMPTTMIDISEYWCDDRPCVPCVAPTGW